MPTKIIFAEKSDVGEILSFIQELAKFEQLEHQVEVTEARLAESLFGPKRYAEVIFLELDGQRAGFALFFHNYSTFSGDPAFISKIYLFVRNIGGGAMERLCSHFWRDLHSSANVVA